MFVSVFKNVFSNPWYLPLRIAKMVPRIVPCSLYLRLLYKFRLGRWPDLTHPKRFTEKLQWLKLHDRNPLYTTLVDKIAVKEYIAEKIGSGYIFKTLGVWNRAEDIDFDSLPEQFVLKCNHYGGGEVFICKDRVRFDFQAAKRGLNRQLREGIYWRTREWPYLHIKPMILAEEYMQDEYGELRDYKVFCFNGIPRYMLVASNRFTAHNFNMFYMDGAPMPIVSSCGKPNDRLVLDHDLLQELNRLSSELSSGIPHVRMDFYAINKKIYFGEFTFFDSSGLDNYGDDLIDMKFGEFLDLSSAKC